VRISRTLIEVVVLGAGWLLGGSVGVGTVVYALAIGPLVQLLLPLFMVPAALPADADADADALEHKPAAAGAASTAQNRA
jgi:uncharacterized membrane protein YczE